MNLLQTAAIEDPPPSEVLDDEPTVEPPTTSRSLRARLRWPLLTTLFLHVLMAVNDRLPSVDGLAYFEAGRNLIGGHGYIRLNRAELHFPPVTPVGLAVLEKLTGSEMRALGIWNVGWGLAVVFAIIALVRRIWDDDGVTVAAAWLAGTMAGLGPLFFRYGGGSEATAAALLLAAAVVAIDGVRTPTEQVLRRMGLLAGSGALVGLAYLSRPEALMPGGIIGFAILGWWWRDRKASGWRIGRAAMDAAAFGIVIAVLSMPYIAYLHTHTGKWSPTAKTQDVSIDAWKAVAENNRLQRDRILYAVNKQGTGLASGTKPLTTLAKENPAEWRQIVMINLGTIRDELLMPQFHVGPAWLLIPTIPLAAALAELWRSRRRGSVQLIVVMGGMPLLTCVMFFTLPRYLVMATAALTILSAPGLVRWLRALRAGPRHVLLGLTVAMMATSFLTTAEAYLPGVPTKDPVDQAETGRWLEQHTPPDARVMTRSYHVQAYSHREIVAMPATDYQSMIRFARRLGVTYIVADASTLKAKRPELYPALMSNWSPPYLKLVHTLGPKGREVRIYQLDPAPPTSDRPPIYLGYVSD